MTRRTTTILGSLLVGLALIATAPAIAADDMSGGGAKQIVVAGGRCGSIDAERLGLCGVRHESGVVLGRQRGTADRGADS
jgi:hypothetical protein